MKKTILLVGNGPMLLRECPGFPGNLSEEWEVQYAPTAREALLILSQQPCAAVVSDLHLPGTNAIQFLDTVLEQQPSAYRFILADLADHQALLSAVAAKHQFIPTPCDDRVLAAALQRTEQLDLLFGSDEVKKALGRIQKMPSPPSVYFQIVKELQSPNASMDSIGEIISRDQAVTAKLLQMVNSAALGLHASVSNTSDAVLHLGIETTKSMVLLAHTYSYYAPQSLGGYSIDALWSHSLATAQMAQIIARAESAPQEVREESFTAGLLHDLGKVLLLMNETEKFLRMVVVRNWQELSAEEAERQVFGFTHGQLGAWLAAIWGLPTGIVEAISLHHYPTRLVSQGFCALTAVHVANSFAHELDTAQDKPPPPPIDLQYLTHLGLENRLNEWRELCGLKPLALPAAAAPVVTEEPASSAAAVAVPDDKPSPRTCSGCGAELPANATEERCGSCREKEVALLTAKPAPPAEPPQPPETPSATPEPPKAVESEPAASASRPRSRRGVVLATLAVVGAMVGAAFVLQKQFAGKEGRLDQTASEQEAQWTALLNQARAYRTSGQIGQRVKALEAIAAAVQIHPSVELRTEAIAALCLPDLLEDADLEVSRPKEAPVAFSPDAEEVALVDASSTVRVFKLADGGSRAKWPAAGAAFAGFAFSSDGQWLAGRSDTNTVCWNISSGQAVARLPVRPYPSLHPLIQFSPNGQFLACSDGPGALSLIDAQAGTAISEIKPLSDLKSFAFSPGGRHLALLTGPSIQIRRLPDGELTETLNAPAGSWLSWQWEGSRLAVAGSNRTIQISTAGEYSVPSHSLEVGEPVDRVALQPAGGLVAGSHSHGNTRLWDAATGRLMLTVSNAHMHQFSRDGKRLAYQKSVEAGGLGAWTVVDNSEFRSLAGATNAARAVDVSPDGRLLAAASEDGLRLWKLASSELIDFTPVTDAASLDFDADSLTVTVRDAQQTRRWPITKQTRRYGTDLGFGTPQLVDAAKEGANPVAAEKDRPSASLTTIESPVAGLKAELAASGGITLSSLRQGILLAELAIPAGSRRADRLFFSRDGQHLVAASADGILHSWNLVRIREGLAKLNLAL